MEAGLKVVVFSQFTTMLDIIEAWLASEQIGYVQIRGSVEAGERSRRIKTFNTGKQCRVCCASLLAGGTGIDLTGAQVVIHYDRWWNPAKEEQATARVHRMGQRHPVQVYKLVTTGTLEEKIHRLIEKKRALAAELIVEDDGSVLKTLSREELAGLFQFSG
jgi:SNF2 family DNA or RNA helicase